MFNSNTAKFVEIYICTKIRDLPDSNLLCTNLRLDPPFCTSYDQYIYVCYTALNSKFEKRSI